MSQASANTANGLLEVWAERALKSEEANALLREEVKRLRDALKETIKQCGSDLCAFPSCGCHSETEEALAEQANSPDALLK